MKRCEICKYSVIFYGFKPSLAKVRCNRVHSNEFELASCCSYFEDDTAGKKSIITNELAGLESSIEDFNTRIDFLMEKLEHLNKREVKE